MAKAPKVKNTFSKYSIFAPLSVGADIRVDYPELQKIEEFKLLRPHEMLFVWHYACRASEISRIESPRQRAIEAVNRSLYGVIDSVEHERYIRGNFPERVVAAIDVMQQFIPGGRIRARQMVDTAFDVYEKMMKEIHVSVSERQKDEEGNVISLDPSKAKANADIVATIVKNLPGIVAMQETGFGVAEVGSKDDAGEDDGTELEDYLHNNS